MHPKRPKQFYSGVRELMDELDEEKRFRPDCRGSLHNVVGESINCRGFGMSCCPNPNYI
jgi:hypothetical protein